MEVMALFSFARRHGLTGDEFEKLKADGVLADVGGVWLAFSPKKLALVDDDQVLVSPRKILIRTRTLEEARRIKESLLRLLGWQQDLKFGLTSLRLSVGLDHVYDLDRFYTQLKEYARTTGQSQPNLNRGKVTSVVWVVSIPGLSEKQTLFIRPATVVVQGLSDPNVQKKVTDFVAELFGNPFFNSSVVGEKEEEASFYI